MGTNTADAALILSMIREAAEWERAQSRSIVVKPLRELIWYVWEQPRLPRPLVRGKYPAPVPWSRAARDEYDGNSRCPLIIDHVMPASVVVRRLLARPPANTAALARILNRLEYVVITPAENQRLLAAGLASTLVPGSKNPWDRYRTAGLRPRTFRPLEI